MLVQGELRERVDIDVYRPIAVNLTICSSVTRAIRAHAIDDVGGRRIGRQPSVERLSSLAVHDAAEGALIIGPAGVQRFREQQRVRRAVEEMSE